jgi:hypothetical protein
VLRGRTIEGLPSGPSGFIPTGEGGAVAGVADVWAVGDAADAPVKSGGVATGLADLAAADIATGLGLEPGEGLEPPAVRAWLWDGVGGDAPDGGGGTDDAPSPRRPGLAKVPGRFLAPFLEGLALPLPLHELGGPEPGARPRPSR